MLKPGCRSTTRCYLARRPSKRAVWGRVVALALTIGLLGPSGGLPCRNAWLPSGVGLFAQGAKQDSLPRWVAQYQQAKKRVQGSPAQRQRQVRADLEPLLLRMAGLDSEDAFRFVAGEYKLARGELVAASARALVTFSNPRAVEVLVRGLGKRLVSERLAVVTVLEKDASGLDAVGGELIRLAQSEADARIREKLAPTLGRVGTPAAAGGLLRLLRPEVTGKRSRPGTPRLDDLVESVLVEMDSPEVREWLTSAAFKVAGAGSGKESGRRLAVVARVVGRRSLEEARPQLEKLLAHSSGAASGAAASALQAIGAGASLDAIVRVLESGRAKKDLRLRVQALDAIASVREPRALDVLSTFAASKDPKMRAITMGALRRLGAEETLPVLTGGLADKNSSVRAAALRALSGVRHQAIVEPLLALLELEKQKRLRYDALQLLVGLSGRNFGFVVKDWRKWWSIAQLNFKPFDPKSEGKGVTAVRVPDAESAEYFGLEVNRSDRVTFVLDVSGSMSGEVDLDAGGKATKISVLKAELRRVFEKLSDRSFVNLIAFDDAYRPWKKRLQLLRGNGRKEAMAFISGLRPRGGTNLFDSLVFALEDANVDTIYLLSDGMPSAGRLTAPGAILAEIELLNRARAVTIHCIAFGAKSSLLENLAAQNNGEYRFVNSN